MALIQLQVGAEEREAILRLHREASRVWPPRPPISLPSVFYGEIPLDASASLEVGVASRWEILRPCP